MITPAIILAAGLSSRMQEFKPLLPLGNVTALEKLIKTFHRAGVEDVRVVVGHRYEELTPLIGRCGARAILNPHYEEGMFSSVLTGIRDLPPDIDAFFMQPVDVPLIREASLSMLLQTFDPKYSDLLYPTFSGKRGHPPLIAGRHAQTITRWHGEGGLRTYLNRFERHAQNVAVADELILHDMDTPDAYRTLLAREERKEIPTPEECRELLTILKVKEEIIRHGREVARVAVELGKLLNQAGWRFDLPLLDAAGQLHDSARQSIDHARTGAATLRAWGFGAVADLVEPHMDLTVTQHELITPEAILFLADKLVNEDRLSTLEERFQLSLGRHTNQPEVLLKVRNRLHSAKLIQQQIEKILGSQLMKILTTGSPTPSGHAC